MRRRQIYQALSAAQDRKDNVAVKVSTLADIPMLKAEPVKRKGGRPPGAKNKPKGKAA